MDWRSANGKIWSFISLVCIGVTPSAYADLELVASREPQPSQVTLTTHNLPPYGSFFPDNTFRGKAADVVSCALDDMNVALDLKVQPWRRAQVEVEQGRADGFFAGSQNARRDDYATKSVIIADQKWQWYLLKESNWSPDQEQFRTEATVSSFLGANMQKWLVENNYNVAATPPNTEALATMLLAGRIDAALANNYVMDGILSDKGLSYRVKNFELKNKPLYVYFSNDFVAAYPAFLPQFNHHAQQCLTQLGHE